MADEETTAKTEETKDSKETTEEETTGTEETTEEKVEAEDSWQQKARKHERAAKKERKAREETERKLKEREEGDKSSQQKALDAAKEEGRKEASTAAAKERRHDRLEAKCVTVAARGIKVGDGDDAKTLKFADPDDALVYIDRAIREGDVDEDDIFDSEGKVNTDALTTALKELLERKPHLQADAKAKPDSDPDTRKGDPANNDLESMSVEELAQRKYGKK